MSEKRLFITRMIVVVVAGTAGAAMSPMLTRVGLAVVVVAIGLLYYATNWLPQRRSEQ